MDKDKFDIEIDQQVIASFRANAELKKEMSTIFGNIMTEVEKYYNDPDKKMCM